MAEYTDKKTTPLRYWLSNRVPPFHRVLIIESGSRDLVEDLLPGLYEIYGDAMQLHLVTCYAGVPSTLKADAKIWRVTDFPGSKGRRELLRQLRQQNYTVAGILCSGEPILLKWKWFLALGLSAKFFILNENGDYFWLDRGHRIDIRHFILFRLGLAGEGAVATIGRLLLFPFAIAYLAAFAIFVHLRRALSPTDMGPIK